MNAVWQLTKADGRHLIRDPMLALSVGAPLLLLIFLRFGTPLLGEMIQNLAGLNLHHYHELILGQALLLVALMEGILTGLLMLDERDEKLLSYYAVTPLTKRGYLLYRLAVPFLLSGMGGAALLLWSGLSEASFGESLPLLLLIALEGPLYALVMAAMAANKVEGLAFSKAIGASVLIPAASLFLPDQWAWLFAPFPTFWPVQLMASSESSLLGVQVQGLTLSEPVVLFLAILYHGVLLWAGYRAFWRRTE
ncbi:hypothetical protein NDK47_06490 [Brevibacillus ruminantium]|uniref:ABC transporter permease n=1 Tax=Brevibacillus ruminantium TaxID=2950604 RepID=A0ABY4WQQ0_9BACL|nr:hypothetical protein [Brevibacillus ruminantium]USG66941.1 hypothetical protein NDK47_06490 [Brevibacillus ruminantium]